MNQFNPNLFFFSDDDLKNFHYETYKFGGLRFFMELAIFLAVNTDTKNPKSCLMFFKMCRDHLEKIEDLKLYDGYKYSAASLINFLLFVQICRFEKRANALDFLENHKEWAMFLGFYNGIPNESDITKFINKLGTDLDIYFIQLLEFIHENVSLDGITSNQIVGLLKNNNRVGIRQKKGKNFTNYGQKRKQASTHWAGMTLILDALYGLGIINLIENIPVKEKVRGYPMLQISLALIVKMITGLEDLHELKNEVEDDPLLSMFCTIEGENTPSTSTLSRDLGRYSVTDLQESYKLIIQWLKELELIDGNVIAIDSSKIYAEGEVQEGTGEVYDYLKKEHKKGYKIFAIYDPLCGILIDFMLFPINNGDNPNLIPLIERAKELLGKSTIKKVFFDRGFYDGKHFDWLNENDIQFVCRGKQGTKVADQLDEIKEEEYKEEKLHSPKEYQPKTARGKKAKEQRDLKKNTVKIAEKMVDVTHCKKKLRAIAVKVKHKKHIEIWLSNIPAATHSAKEIIDEYRNRWGIEVFFKEEKSYWYLNELPSRKLEVVKCVIYFNFIAYNLISVFKKTLTEKYNNVGIKVLRREVLRKNAIICFDVDGFELEFNGKKAKESYIEQFTSICHFVENRRKMIDLLCTDSVSNQEV